MFWHGSLDTIRVFIFRPVWPFSKSGICMSICIETHRDTLCEPQEWEGQEGWRLCSHLVPFSSRSKMRLLRAGAVLLHLEHVESAINILKIWSEGWEQGHLGEHRRSVSPDRAQQSISQRIQQLPLRSICLFMQEVNRQENFQNIEQEWLHHNIHQKLPHFPWCVLVMDPNFRVSVDDFGLPLQVW